MKTLLILLVILTSAVQQLKSEQGNVSTKVVSCSHTDEKIVIDGVLSEKIWQRAPFTEFTQQDPNQGQDPSYKSEAWFAYDESNLYFAARYYDPSPDSVLARLVRRDFVWGDPSDGTVLYLDTYHDRRNGYFFYVSAAGTLADGTLENDTKQTDLTWDAVWEGVPHFDSLGWTVEMRIPFSQLRFQAKDIQEWGFNVERFVSRRGETDMVAYTPRNESGFASRFPSLIGIQGVHPSTKLELMPYVTGKAEYIGNDPKDPFNGEKYLPGSGLDIKAGLGNSLNLNATINPDFGQVEVDPAIVNLSDVEYSFTEKRPFFTEGVNIFRFGNGGINNNWNFNWSNPNIFYSRRIGRAPQRYVNADYKYVPTGTHIIGAGKISGRLDDNWKIGSIHALTNREMADIEIGGSRSRLEVEPMTYYGVLRAQRDFNKGAQGLGILGTYTNRFFKDAAIENMLNKNAFTLAADGWTFLDNEGTYVLTGWMAGSRVSGTRERITALQKSSLHYFQRPDASYLGVDTNATSMTGYAGRFMVNKNRGRFSFNTAIGFLSPQFEINDLGYGSFSNNINGHFAAEYRWLDPTPFYRNLGVYGAYGTNFDYGWTNTFQGYILGGNISFLDLSYGGAQFTYTPESYSARRTRGGPLTLNPSGMQFSANYGTNNRKWWYLQFQVNSQQGKAYRSIDYYTSLEVKVNTALTLTVAPDFRQEYYAAQWVTSYTDPTAVNTYNKRYIFAQLNMTTLATDIRADWILTPSLSVQVYVQPFISAGKYSNFKNLSRSKSFDFTNYGENGSTLVKNVSESGDVSYNLDPDGSGPAASKTVYNPDFKYISLRGNAVLRWEYMPGSALYLVWTQSREDMESIGSFEFDRSIRTLVDTHPDNIFMLKVTYWLGM